MELSYRDRKMRFKSILIIFVVGLFLIISLSQAQASICNIKLASQCSPGNTLLKMFSFTNAHAQDWQLNTYNYALCCNVALGHTSTGANSIVLRLSGTQNAHAEIPNPQNPNYQTGVFFSNGLHTCRSVSSTVSCALNEISVVELTGATNAHLGSISSPYNTKICCRVDSSVVPSSCGNGVLNEGEECDGNLFRPSFSQCSHLAGFSGGLVSCDATCKVDTSRCTTPSGAIGYCGDGILHPGESCDGINVGGMKCDKLGYASNSAPSCNSFCNYNLEICEGGTSLCGNGDVDPGEQCDTDNIPSTCQLQGYSGGTLRCNSPGTANECTFNYGLCTGSPLCGNGNLDPGEQCDTDIVPSTCELQGYSGGILRCNPPGINGCQYNYDLCTIVPADSELVWTNIYGEKINEIMIIPEATKVGLVHNRTGLPLNTEVTFSIYEDDPVFGDDEIRTGANALMSKVNYEDYAMAIWRITTNDLSRGGFENPGSYYFKTDKTGVDTSNELVGYISDLTCSNIALCMHYTDRENCVADFCGVASASGLGVDCSDPNVECFCDWDESQSECFFDSRSRFCGDGIITASIGEECDTQGPNFGQLTCESFDEFSGGNLVCNSNCKIDTSQCENGNGPGICGNKIVNTGETCDGNPGDPNPPGYDWGPIEGCRDLGFSGGLLSCIPEGEPDSCHFDTTGCFGVITCGNGMIDPGEQCDGSNLNGQSCPGPGTVSCDDTCHLDFSGCTGGASVCGDGILEGTEQCEPHPNLNLNGADCASQVGSGSVGTLNCYPALRSYECTYDTSGCSASNSGICLKNTVSVSGDCGDDNTNEIIVYWTGTWTGGGAVPAECPANGQTVIACPAKIKLSFFEGYQLIISLLLIAGIYFILLINKRKGTK